MWSVGVTQDVYHLDVIPVAQLPLLKHCRKIDMLVLLAYGWDGLSNAAIHPSVHLPVSCP